MVGFSTDQIKTLKEFAAPIPYHLRDGFLQELAHELRHCDDVPNDGELFRAMRLRAIDCRQPRCGFKHEAGKADTAATAWPSALVPAAGARDRDPVIPAQLAPTASSSGSREGCPRLHHRAALIDQAGAPIGASLRLQSSRCSGLTS